MVEVMEQLDAVHDELLDEASKLVGRVKDVQEVEKRLRRRQLLRNAWRLLPFFEPFFSAPKDESHQWLVVCKCIYMSVLCKYLVYTWLYIIHTCM
jgi:hypothetical protein